MTTKGLLYIKILKMDEYNPRKDRKRHHWFRMDNKVPFSRKLDKLDGDQCWFFTCLLAFASEDQTDVVAYDIDYLEKHCKCSKKKIELAIRLLQENDTIALVGKDGAAPFLINGNQSVTERSPDLPTELGVVTERCPTDVRTDITLHTYNAAAGFERAWNAIRSIPGMVKGAKAVARFEDQISDEAEESALLSSIANYKAVLAIQNWRTPKTSFETFLGTKSSGFFWREFEAMPEIPQAKATPSNVADEAAATILAAIKSVPDGDIEEMQRVLGDLWPVYRAAGGRSRLGPLKPFEFRKAIEASLSSIGIKRGEAS